MALGLMAIIAAWTFLSTLDSPFATCQTPSFRALP